MYACIHASADPALLIACAQAFSPVVEQAAPDIAVLDAAGLGRIHGTAHEIATAIAGRARLLGFDPHIAIASNPDAAICAARGFLGVSVIPHGDEAKFLESLPLHLLAPGEELLETFDRWGVRTFRDLALLPPIGIAGRLGEQGVRLQMLARGECERPLVPLTDPLEFRAELELDYPVELLEPLSFVLSRLLSEICGSLAQRGLAAIEVRLRLALEDKSEHERTLQLPVPMCDPRTFLKLMQLDLGAHPPAAAVIKVYLDAVPAKPRVAQGGLFIATAPEPEKLEVTLARVTALVGEGNAGSPELLDTHRPDAFRMRRFGTTPKPNTDHNTNNTNTDTNHTSSFSGADPLVRAGPPGPATGKLAMIPTRQTRGSAADQGVRPTEIRERGGKRKKEGEGERKRKKREKGERETQRPGWGISFRFYRPPLPARVQVEHGLPSFLLAGGIRGHIVSASGPWRTSGDWWTLDPWDRDEWDVSLREGAIYCIYYAHATGQWFVEGSFD